MNESTYKFRNTSESLLTERLHHVGKKRLSIAAQLNGVRIIATLIFSLHPSPLDFIHFNLLALTTAQER